MLYDTMVLSLATFSQQYVETCISPSLKVPAKSFNTPSFPKTQWFLNQILLEIMGGMAKLAF